MRRTILVLGILFSVASIALPAGAAFKVPMNDGYVTDDANVLSDSAEQSLEAMAKELDEKTKSQMAILTVPSLDGTPLEEASLEVGRKWGIGDKKNRGLLILFALNDRKFRAEIGYGLEGTITDGTSGQIRDRYMRPYFKQGNYEAGLIEGSKVYAYRIAEANGVTLDSLNGVATNTQPNRTHARQQVEEEEGIPWGLLLFGFFFITFFLFPMLFGRRRGSGYYGSPFIGGFGGGDYSGGGGSDFGGFGGGDFGGGGSSGDW